MEKYYYLDNAGKQCGPVEAHELANLGVTAGTYVWREGMSDWKRAGELPELSAYVGGAAPGAQPQPGYAPGSQPVGGYMFQPSSNLVWAILTTILCCMPTGIYAIICAARVDPMWAAGRYEEARQMSRKAAQWSIISVVAAVVWWILYYVIFAAAIASLALSAESLQHL